MIKKFMMPVAALVLAAGLSAAPLSPAEAGRGGRVAAGIAAGLLAGALIYHYHRRHGYYDTGYCYRGEERCRKVRRCWYNRYGERRCKRRWKCWRPVYCD